MDSSAVVQHHPEECKSDDHCYIHAVDEPRGEVYCGECFHSWATKADLLADYNAEMEQEQNWWKEQGLRDPGSDEDDEEFIPVESADEIWVCPHCGHDF